MGAARIVRQTSNRGTGTAQAAPFRLDGLQSAFQSETFPVATLHPVGSLAAAALYFDQLGSERSRLWPIGALNEGAASASLIDTLSNVAGWKTAVLAGLDKGSRLEQVDAGAVSVATDEPALRVASSTCAEHEANGAV